MTIDPLYHPLGTTPRPQVKRGAGLLALVAAVLVGAGGAAAVMRQTSPAADRNIAVAAIEVAPKAVAPPPAAPSPAAPSPTASFPTPPALVAPTDASARPAQASAIDDLNRANGDTVEIQNGVKIIRLGAALSSKSVAIPVPDAPPVAAFHQAKGLALR